MQKTKKVPQRKCIACQERDSKKVLLQAGSTKTGNKTLTYTVQGLFGLAVT